MLRDVSPRTAFSHSALWGAHLKECYQESFWVVEVNSSFYGTLAASLCTSHSCAWALCLLVTALQGLPGMPWDVQALRRLTPSPAGDDDVPKVSLWGSRPSAIFSPFCNSVSMCFCSGPGNAALGAVTVLSCSCWSSDSTLSPWSGAEDCDS